MANTWEPIIGIAFLDIKKTHFQYGKHQFKICECYCHI